MFYCDPCKRKNNWPESINGSKGQCEVCKKLTVCHHVPSSQLPILYPECEKLAAIAPQSQRIGDFIAWLREEKQIILGHYNREQEYMTPAQFNIEKLLAEFFEINLDMIEKEKQEILENLK